VTPGPGYYNTISSELRNHPSVKIGTSIKDITNVNNNPGPGAYKTVERPFSAGPRYLFNK
jgi:hypothetical protein